MVFGTHTGILTKVLKVSSPLSSSRHETPGFDPKNIQAKGNVKETCGTWKHVTPGTQVLGPSVLLLVCSMWNQPKWSAKTLLSRAPGVGSDFA